MAREFVDSVLKSRKVAVWGSGYLAYTTLLRLQSRGLRALVYDFNPGSLQYIRNKNYPIPEQLQSWSVSGTVPALDFNILEVADSADEMFDPGIRVHLISMPSSYQRENYNSNLLRLAKEFSRYAGQKTLIVFQSASGPGCLSRDFIGNLGEVSDSYYIGTAFRSDWSIEDFLAGHHTQVISGVDQESADITEAFMGLLSSVSSRVSSIKSAELLENGRNSLEFTINACLNQLAMAYPDVNMHEVLPRILDKRLFQNCQIGLGSGGYRMPGSMENLIRESSYGNSLTILAESSSFNLSSMLCYANYIKRSGFKSVAILGVSARQDLYMPVSLILAETLVKQGLRVFLHDPYYSSGEKLRGMIKGTEWFDFEKRDFSGIEAVVLNSDHYLYQHITQQVIDREICGLVKLVIDAVNVWCDYNFTEGTVYHRTGDGTLDVFKPQCAE